MVFILDNAIRNTLISDDGRGRHAMYDWICWEYLVGQTQEPHSFTQRKELKVYQEALAERRVITTREVDSDIDQAIDRFDTIVTRWCFPRKEFVLEVITYLCQCLEMCVAWAIKEEGREDKLKGSDWDARKAFNYIFRDLYKSVDDERFVAREQETWTSVGHMMTWLKQWGAQVMESSRVGNEKLDPSVTSRMFNWNAEKKFPGLSLAAGLIRHLGGFVKICQEKQVKGFRAEYPAKFLQLGEQGSLWKPTEFWWFLNDRVEISHGINEAPRCNYVDIGKSTDAAAFLVDLQNRVNKGESYDTDLFRWGMVLSGYGPEKLAFCLNQHGQRCRDDRLVPFSARDQYLEVDFVTKTGQHLTMGKGQRILAQNWVAIKHDVLLTFREPLGRVTEGRETRAAGGGKGEAEAKLDAGMVPSDTAHQPKGLNLTVPKAEKDEEEQSYVIPFVVFAGGLIGYLLLNKR